MSQSVQELIHKFEEGAGKKVLGLVLAWVALLGLGVVMDTKFARNMTTPDGMEAAQLARNLAEGKGYVSGVMRPLAIRLLDAKAQPASPLLRDPHQPDLQNPPLYPVLLAGWLKLNPFGYRIPEGVPFRVFRPDLWVAIFNQIWLAVAALLVYRLALRLFDATAAWMSTAIFLGTWLFWQMTYTGHSTSLLIVLVLLLVNCLVRLAEAVAADVPRTGAKLLWCALAGVCLGLATLTRYSAGWLILPVFIFLVALPYAHVLTLTPSGPEADATPAGVSLRIQGILAMLAACALLVAPWLYRNADLSGSPFGTAGYAVFAGTEAFPEDTLERALYPRFDTFDPVPEMRRKVVNNVRDILFGDLPRMLGGWLPIFCVAGLLMPFRRPLLNHLRWFLVASFFFLLLAQAGGRTTLSTNREMSDLSSENLIVLVSPLAIIFGVGFALSLVNLLRMEHPVRIRLVHGGIVGFCALPMLMAFVPPLPYVSPIVYPPFFPPFIQRIGRMSPDGTSSLWAKEVVMSDVPQAITWYSRCPSMILSLNYRVDPAEKVKDDFFELNDYRRTVKALYLTQRTLKTIPVKGVVDEGKDIRSKWENFIGVLMIQRKLPPEFPLQNWADGIWPEQLYAEAGTRR